MVSSENSACVGVPVLIQLKTWKSMEEPGPACAILISPEIWFREKVVWHQYRWQRTLGGNRVSPGAKLYTFTINISPKYWYPLQGWAQGTSTLRLHGPSSFPLASHGIEGKLFPQSGFHSRLVFSHIQYHKISSANQFVSDTWLKHKWTFFSLQSRLPPSHVLTFRCCCFLPCPMPMPALAYMNACICAKCSCSL